MFCENDVDVLKIANFWNDIKMRASFVKHKPHLSVTGNLFSAHVLEGNSEKSKIVWPEKYEQPKISRKAERELREEIDRGSNN